MSSEAAAGAPWTIEQGVVIGSIVYLALLIVLGWLGFRARKDKSLSDHFLAGRSIGLIVLLLTLFATQYSGNSLSGFPGKTYRVGLENVMCVTFMVGIVAGYLLFAPRLFKLSRKHQFVTPSDFLWQRYRSKAIHYISVVVLIFVLANFMLAQIKAMGNAYAGITHDDSNYVLAVVVGAAVILAYELLGGMRAVVWTDALQGVILIVGLLLAAVLLVSEIGSPAAVVAQIQEQAPEKAQPPSARSCLSWLSYLLLLGLGAPLYPQAIQRIYAARSGGELKRAFVCMSFLPLVAISTVVFIGLAGIVLFDDLTTDQSDRITFLVLRYLVDHQPMAYFPVVIVMLAVLAAIMSTADSCLLSMTSIFAKDMRSRESDPTEVSGTRHVPWISVGIMTVLVGVALIKGITLWGLLTIKFEVLIQISPAFVLGAWHEADDPNRFRARDILRGLLTGLVVGVGAFVALRMAGTSTLWGIHAGVIGVIANYLVVFVSRGLR